MWDRKEQHNETEITKEVRIKIMSKSEKLRKAKYVHRYADVLRGKRKEIL